MLKLVVLVSVLFIGVIIGFQEANYGLKKMKGFDDGSFTAVFSIREGKESGDLEAVIFGETVNSETLEEKKKVLEEIYTYNLFTDIAKTLTHLLQNIFSLILPDHEHVE